MAFMVVNEIVDDDEHAHKLHCGSDPCGPGVDILGLPGPHRPSNPAGDLTETEIAGDVPPHITNGNVPQAFGRHPDPV